MSTPRFVLSCLTSLCHPSSYLRTQDPLYSSPLPIAFSGPLCLRPRFYCATKTLMSTSKINIYAGVIMSKTTTLIFTPKTTISTPESIMPTSLYLQPRGFREIRLPCFYSLRLRLTLAVSTPVVSFRSTHHSVCSLSLCLALAVSTPVMCSRRNRTRCRVCCYTLFPREIAGTTPALGASSCS